MCVCLCVCASGFLACVCVCVCVPYFRPWYNAVAHEDRRAQQTRPRGPNHGRELLSFSTGSHIASHTHSEHPQGAPHASGRLPAFCTLSVCTPTCLAPLRGGRLLRLHRAPFVLRRRRASIMHMHSPTHHKRGTTPAPIGCRANILSITHSRITWRLLGVRPCWNSVWKCLRIWRHLRSLRMPAGGNRSMPSHSAASSSGVKGGSSW